MKASFVVCGTISAEDAYEARCSKCTALVYPTIGTHARARREGIPLICVDCWRAMPAYEFGGFMKHGKMLPKTDMFKEIARIIREQK